VGFHASLPGVLVVVEFVARGVGVAVQLRIAFQPCQAGELAEAPLLDHWARRRLLLCGRSAEAQPEAACLRGALRALWSGTSIVGEYITLPE
jgi:hypothetical protein